VLVGGFCTIRKAATRKFGNRLATRTKRVAAKSIAAIPAESIPVIGVAVLIADTGYELYAACETVKDLDQLYSDLGMEAHIQAAVGNLGKEITGQVHAGKAGMYPPSGLNTVDQGLEWFRHAITLVLEGP
jgi:hypothetical protein